MKNLFYFLLSAVLVSPKLFAQECTVEEPALKGTYTGDCKKGKAHGKGKATGADIYDGDFKSGLPDGKGTYTWSNGNIYEGSFKSGLMDGKGIYKWSGGDTYEGLYSKGMREGKGTMTFKIKDRADSVVTGFWRKDRYIGKNEEPWKVHGKTGSIRTVGAEFSDDIINRIKIMITNTTGGVKTFGGGEMPRLKVDNVQILSGNFARMTTLESHYKSTETSLIQAEFPLRVKLTIGKEELDIEFFEAGSYTVSISINN